MNFEQLINQYGYCVVNAEASNGNTQKPIATEYNTVVLCYSGQATIEANMQQFTLTTGSCMSLANVVFMRTVSLSPDFRASILVCSRKFALEATMGVPTEYIEQVFLNPIVKIDNTALWQVLVNSFDNMSLLQEQSLNIKHSEVTSMTFRSIIITVAHIVMQNNGGAVVKHYSQADVYFRQFIDLIHEHVDKEHEVAYYARQLNLTAKYLSEICKQKCGRKAKEVISAFLITRIKRDIITSGKSAKVLAYEYGFADQSSMGKFFTKMTGQSPTAFRQENT
jgi:YesN/AraC family two-component response regulator